MVLCSGFPTAGSIWINLVFFHFSWPSIDSFLFPMNPIGSFGHPLSLSGPKRSLLGSKPRQKQRDLQQRLRDAKGDQVQVVTCGDNHLPICC